jgi:hypothetical protein
LLDEIDRLREENSELKSAAEGWENAYIESGEL